MRPRVRALLACSLALALVAGCLGAPGSQSPSADPTASPSAEQSATALPGDLVAWPDGPKERPPVPATLNESSVESYVHTHEYRYVYNSLWFDETSEVTADCGVDEVRRADGAWRATVTCTAYSNSGGELPNGTATSTIVHADYFTQTWVYWIDEREDGDTVVHRVRAEE